MIIIVEKTFYYMYWKHLMWLLFITVTFLTCLLAGSSNLQAYKQKTPIKQVLNQFLQENCFVPIIFVKL